MAKMLDMPVLIATLLHEHGPTGVQSHFNTFRGYLERSGGQVSVVTPFLRWRWCAFPLFALRRLLDPVSSSAGTWWYRHWHAVFVRLELQRRLLNGAPCILYVQCPLAAHVALAARSNPNQRVVLVVHFNGSQAYEWSEKGKISAGGALARAILRFEAQELPKVDGIVYVSRYMKAVLEQRIPALRPVANAVIPNFCNHPAEAAAGEPVDIINIGTLEPRKNQEFLLRVVAAASAMGRHYSLAFIGDGPDRARLQQLAGALNVGGQIRFLGYQPGAAQYLRTAKLYAHSATVENLPIAIIEAMACGLPVLAAAVGGIPDLFENGRQGFFWQLDSPQEGARILISVLEDSRLRAALGAAGKQRFEEQFSVSRVAQQLARFLHERSVVAE
jgi:glycosyltransferase involved in cell wall biosynthesis